MGLKAQYVSVNACLNIMITCGRFRHYLYHAAPEISSQSPEMLHNFTVKST